jgi:Arc/MetJ-type ribon-helix-helix transcriptional regulator
VSVARVTVYIPDELVERANRWVVRSAANRSVPSNMSALVQAGLEALTEGPARPEASKRGRLEALRAVRAASDALADVELALTQAKPVKRRVRRYPGGRAKARGA